MRRPLVVSKEAEQAYPETEWTQKATLLAFREAFDHGREFERSRQVVTTVEELDALPVGTVILDRDHCSLQSGEYHFWYEPGVEVAGRSNSVALPARVLFRPDTEEGTK